MTNWHLSAIFSEIFNLLSFSPFPRLAGNGISSSGIWPLLCRTRATAVKKYRYYFNFMLENNDLVIIITFIFFLKDNIFWLSGQVLELTMVPFSPEFSPTLSGGGLSEKYKLAKIVFHWGVMSGSGVNSFVSRRPSWCKIFTGSEHTKSSTSFSMEIQIVHFREDLSDLDTALANSDWNSIAIVSIFYNVQYNTSFRFWFETSLSFLVGAWIKSCDCLWHWDHCRCIT